MLKCIKKNLNFLNCDKSAKNRREITKKNKNNMNKNDDIMIHLHITSNDVKNKIESRMLSIKNKSKYDSSKQTNFKNMN